MNLEDEDASMPAPPPPMNLSSQFGPYGVFVGPAVHGAPMLEPGDRVGGPPPRRRRRMLRALVLLCLAGPAAGWLMMERRDDVAALASLATAALQDLQQARQLPQGATKEDARREEPLPTSEREIAPLPTIHAEPDARSTAPAEPTSPAANEITPDTEAAPERLPAVTADPADPRQQKALAAGLHPDLSRTLLDRLTPEDFQNAAYAVNAVLSGEKSAAPFVWPRQRAPKRAQFKVRIVAGAPSECRRYVVQIAMDRWETTARPMERCSPRQAFKPS